MPDPPVIARSGRDEAVFGSPFYSCHFEERTRRSNLWWTVRTIRCPERLYLSRSPQPCTIHPWPVIAPKADQQMHLLASHPPGSNLCHCEERMRRSNLWRLSQRRSAVNASTPRGASAPPPVGRLIRLISKIGKTLLTLSSTEALYFTEQLSHPPNPED